MSTSPSPRPSSARNFSSRDKGFSAFTSSGLYSRGLFTCIKLGTEAPAKFSSRGRFHTTPPPDDFGCSRSSNYAAQTAAPPLLSQNATEERAAR
mmetsp:Transcript_33317/g.78529  ORF Transcript_33317/g.78529 Transcript_33317/m.78529 type:complete len:94 (+) Transcript_33317:647-928(+)